MTTEEEKRLWEQLLRAFRVIGELNNWLARNLPSMLPELGPGNLSTELTTLLRASDAQDGRQALFQALCDDPPDPDIPYAIFVYTHGTIKSKTPYAAQLPPHQRTFVASRPFVNRTNLRKQLQELATSAGGKRILVVDGDSRSGKSFAMSMALETAEPESVQWPINIDDYATSGVTLDAREFAIAIVGHENGCPAFDLTKEDEAVPRLMTWLATELQNKKIWIIIDHCNRQVMTRAAGRLLKLLVDRLYQGGLNGVRLILADFNRNELPPQLQNMIRYDRAELPVLQHVEEWCRQVAKLEQREFDEAEPAQWANDVFAGLQSYRRDDGSWHMVFEQRLMRAAEVIRSRREPV